MENLEHSTHWRDSSLKNSQYGSTSFSKSVDYLGKDIKLFSLQKLNEPPKLSCCQLLGITKALSVPCVITKAKKEVSHKGTSDEDPVSMMTATDQTISAILSTATTLQQPTSVVVSFPLVFEASILTWTCFPSVSLQIYHFCPHHYDVLHIAL